MIDFGVKQFSYYRNYSYICNNLISYLKFSFTNLKVQRLSCYKIKSIESKLLQSQCLEIKLLFLYKYRTKNVIFNPVFFSFCIIQVLGHRSKQSKDEIGCLLSKQIDWGSLLQLCNEHLGTALKLPLQLMVQSQSWYDLPSQKHYD